MVHRRMINRRYMPEEEIDLQNEWEDSLSKDSLPKFKFPINFIDDFDGLDLSFNPLEIKPPEPAKKNTVKTVTFKKTKGGLF
jgi:hypothetical protein